MNEIIKNIEAAQLKAEVPAFNTGESPAGGCGWP